MSNAALHELVLLLVHLLILLSFFKGFPLFTVILESLDGLIFLKDTWHHLTKRLEERHGDEVDEARLCSGHVGRVSVAEHTDWQIYFLFQVTLGEEFLEQQIGPLLGGLEGSGALRHVTGVETALQYELLVLELSCWVFVSNVGKGQLLTVWFDVKLLNSSLHSRQVSGMFGHISCQNHTHNSFPEQLELIPVQIWHHIQIVLRK